MQQEISLDRFAIAINPDAEPADAIEALATFALRLVQKRKPSTDTEAAAAAVVPNSAAEIERSL